jgi:hypothetical protein
VLVLTCCLRHVSPPAQLCSQLEQLELENRQLKEGVPGAAGAHVDGELLRLQAENTALQKNMAGAWTPSRNVATSGLERSQDGYSPLMGERRNFGGRLGLT